MEKNTKFFWIAGLSILQTDFYISTISENYARERRCKPNDVCKIKAFVGLLYLSGTLKRIPKSYGEEMDIERFWLVVS